MLLFEGTTNKRCDLHAAPRNLAPRCSTSQKSKTSCSAKQTVRDRVRRSVASASVQRSLPGGGHASEARRGDMQPPTPTSPSSCSRQHPHPPFPRPQIQGRVLAPESHDGSHAGDGLAGHQGFLEGRRAPSKSGAANGGLDVLCGLHCRPGEIFSA